MYTSPIRPKPVYVWMTLLMFFCFGVWLSADGVQFHSIGAAALGGMLLIAGIYHTIKWLLVKRYDQEK